MNRPDLPAAETVIPTLEASQDHGTYKWLVGLDEVEAGDASEVVVGGGEGALATEGGGGDPGVGGGERSSRALEVGAQTGGRFSQDGVGPDDLQLVDSVSQAQCPCLSPAARVSPIVQFFKGLE